VLDKFSQTLIMTHFYKCRF